MEHSRIILSDLLRQQKVTTDGYLANYCETELKELMKQIDIVMNTKTSKWEQEVKSLQQKLQTRQTECDSTRDRLEWTQTEVAKLQQNVSLAESKHRRTVQEYEKELVGVREQLLTMRREYDRLCRKHEKRQQTKVQMQEQASVEQQHSAYEIEAMRRKLNDFATKESDWGKKEEGMRCQVDALTQKNNELSSKSKSLTQALSHSQEQLQKAQEEAKLTATLKSRLNNLEVAFNQANCSVTEQFNVNVKLRESLRDLQVAHKAQYEQLLQRTTADGRSSQSVNPHGERAQLTALLQQQAVSIKAMNDNASFLDKQLGDVTAQSEQKSAELRTRLAEIDILQRENAALRSSAKERCTRESREMANGTKKLEEENATLKQTVRRLEDSLAQLHAWLDEAAARERPSPKSPKTRRRADGSAPRPDDTSPALVEFVTNVDQLLRNCSTWSENNQTELSSTERERDSVTRKFLLEEERQQNELENLLDAHMLRLQEGADKILNKLAT
ncbi:PREDICTED: centrosomal protein of 63 kDa-like [Priapulus caudatus]|uniref:Centrosomal protein of 63 kDa-like n=1 Tax=Priapulus caudatus TaxID=37621 RepID=A0ABM1ETD5_PRICU|nr:PREDICTED: centrosomal protein of 63 kDa-like [Priapulus caudatus]